VLIFDSKTSAASPAALPVELKMCAASPAVLAIESKMYAADPAAPAIESKMYAAGLAAPAIESKMCAAGLAAPAIESKMCAAGLAALPLESTASSALLSLNSQKHVSIEALARGGFFGMIHGADRSAEARCMVVVHAASAAPAVGEFHFLRSPAVFVLQIIADAV
jgi:hypothetical protein